MDSWTGSADISLVCCGLFGTLVADDDLIERSFGEAIATQGVVAGTSAFARRMAQVHRVRGRAPRDVLSVLFPDNEPRAQAAALAFDRALPDALSRTAPALLPGAVETLDSLRAGGRRVCVVTSLSRRILRLVVEGAGLQPHIDLALGLEDAPRGFPAPDLALTAMLQASVASVQEVALVHATGAGVEGGRNSGAGVVVGVLTGAHSAARLRDAGAAHVLRSIADLPALLDNIRPGASPAAGPQPGKSANGAAAKGPAKTTPGTIEIPPQAPAEHSLGGH